MTIAHEMRVVELDGFGGPEVLGIGRAPVPVPGEGEVLIRVVAAGFNRADLVQREGGYPPPPGITDVLGLECSGTVVALGPGARRFGVGDAVCALLAGGGYAEYAAVPEAQVLPVPGGVDLVEAAGLPEVACTLLSNFAHPELPPAGSSLLVHGGSGGLGGFAVQLGAALGWRVFATAGSEGGVEHSLAAGAEAACNYREEDFVEFVRERTGGRGVDLVLDVVGGSYLQRNLAALAVGGRLAMVAALGGATAEIDLRVLMRRRLAVHGSTLRARPVHGPGSKEEIVRAVERTVWPLIESGALRPLAVHRVPFARVRELHERHGDRTVPPGKSVLVLGE